MLTRAALRNPVAVLMIAVAVVVLGWVSLRRIPVDLFPDISVPVVVVGVVYPGAGPKDIEASVTMRLERAVASVPGVTYIESTSRQGLSVVRVQFDWGADVDVGAADCVQRVQQIMGSLPPGAQQPFVIKIDLSNIAVVGLSVTGAGLDDRALYDLAYNVIEPQLEHLKGVATAGISGGLVRQITVLADRAAIEARGLTTQDLVDAIAAANFLLPSGNLRVGPLDYNVFTETQIPVADRIGDVPVRVSAGGGAPVLVRDVALVRDGSEDQTNIVRVNGRPGVNLWVRKQPGANTIEVVDRILTALPDLRGIPEGVEINPTFNQSTYIRNAIQSLLNEALMGSLLAVAVIFLFLRSFRSTLVIALSIPLSLMATFMLLFFVGHQSLNIFTIGGLALGVGRLVDDSIVVLENVFRHRERGEPPLQAALEGAREVAMPVLASTVATIAVFFPVVFLVGIAKLLFIPLTLAVVFALAASYFAAMAVVPPLTERIAPAAAPRGAPGLYRRFLARWKSAFDALDAFYARVLRAALRRRIAVVLAILAVFAGSMALFPRLGTEFFPRTDESQFQGNLKAPLGTRVEETALLATRVEQTIRETLGPAVATVVTDSGIRQSGMGAIWSGNAGPHQATIRVQLVPPDRRDLSDQECVERVRRALGGLLPGVQAYFDTGGIVRRVMTMGSGAPIDVEVIGYDFDAARAVTRRVLGIVEATPGTTDARTSRDDDYPEIHVTVDREKAARLGMSTRDVAQTVLTSVAGNLNVPGIYTDPVSGNQYWIVVRMRDEDRASLHDLEDVPVRTRSGPPVALRTVASIRPGAGPVQIDRKYQQRIVHVTANVLGRPLGDVASDIESALADLPLPEGFEVSLAGERASQKESFQGLALALVLALLLVYMTMASQFRSLREPFIVMFSVPMGLIGVVWSLYLTGTPLSVNAFMGVIMMVGIVLSNGILLVEFANARLSEGMDPFTAVVEAGRVRLRPILMTTLTTLLGLLPMAIGIGEGSESNVPLARAVVGGLTVSTLFTLVLVPVLYTVFRRRERTLTRS